MLNQLRLAHSAYRVYRDPEGTLDAVLDAVTRLATPDRLELAVPLFARLSPDAAAQLVRRDVLRYSLDDLAKCPDGSLGRAVVAHCRAYGIDPAAFVVRSNRTAGEHIIVHIESTHDVWHAVTGFASDVPGELGLQAFYMAQQPNLLGHLLMGLMHLKQLRDPMHDHHPMMDEVARGWTMGKRARPLFGYDWAAAWDRPLADVRAELLLS